MIEACDNARDLAVVANLAGGTTSMKLGIVLGRGSNGQFLLVQGSPLRSEFIQGYEQVVVMSDAVRDALSAQRKAHPAIGKTAVNCSDSTGFVVNHL